MQRHNAQKRIIFLKTLAQTKKRDYYVPCAPNGALHSIDVWKAKHQLSERTERTKWRKHWNISCFSA